MDVTRVTDGRNGTWEAAPRRAPWRMKAAFALAAWGALMSPACDARDDGELGVPGSVSQEVTEGGPNPAPVPLRVTNRGTCVLSLTATASTTDGKQWLSVSPTGADVDGGTSATLTLAFDVVTTEMVPGNYVGEILLDGTCVATGQPARGSPRGIGVNLRVGQAGATISVGDDNVGVDLTPLDDRWVEMADNTLYPGRASHTAVWTGREMWVFGGVNPELPFLGNGGKYDPFLDDWTTMPTPNAPSGRFGHTAVWTGDEMIIWGGQDSALGHTNTGARLGDEWTPITMPGGSSAPSARSQHTAVWTGTEMIVYGGRAGTVFLLRNGARYDPATDSWTEISTTDGPGQRTAHSAMWTGHHMLVWGGEGLSGSKLGNGAIYDPASDTWSPMAPGGPARSWLISAWTGSHWILFGGEGDDGQTKSDGAMYSPSRDEWTDIPADTQRRADLSSSVWTGRELIVWGGGSGRRFDPETGIWSAVTTVGQPSSRQAASAVWTGSEMILFGGTTARVDGAIYK